MFQEKSLSGFFFLIGIFWGCYRANRIDIALAGLLGLFISNETAKLLKYNQETLGHGLFGYNGILIGMAIVMLGTQGSLSWLLVILASIVATISIKTPWRIPAFTFPFILTSWISIFLILKFFPALPSSELESLNQLDIKDPLFYLKTILHSFSQVFLLKDPATGLLFIIGLLINSFKGTLAALYACLLCFLIPVLLGNSHLASLYDGLYGYSAILSALAVITLKPKSFIRSIPLLTAVVIITWSFQFLLLEIFKPLGIPILTAPFVFGTWVTFRLCLIKLLKD